MAFNITELQAQLQFGGARPTQFMVHITNPFASAGDTKLSFTCRATSAPPSLLGVIRVPYFGRSVPIPGDRQFMSWNVTVINDEDFVVRNALETWSNAINAHQRNVAVSPAPLDLMSQGTITQYGKAGNVIRTYQLNNIFPTQISDMNLDWAATDQLQEFQVTFEYSYWEIISTETGNFTV